MGYTQMNIALDYDDTYTADKNFWAYMIIVGKTKGHNFFIVTVRDDRYDKNETLELLEKNVKVYYTRGVAKKWWMEQFGEAVDIWIDDRPENILNNSTKTKEWLDEWRSTRPE